MPFVNPIQHFTFRTRCVFEIEGMIRICISNWSHQSGTKAELNQEPTVNRPIDEVHHELVQDNQRPKQKKKLPDWLRDYVV